MVRIQTHQLSPDDVVPGAIAQLGERLLCKQEVTGSIPVGSTSVSLKCLVRSVLCALRSRYCIGCSLTIRKK
jgi:hypothetical protein